MKDINNLSINEVYTYADYLTWQFQEQIELIKGKVFKMSPAPSLEHQSVSGNLFGEIFQYLKKKNCRVFAAPFDVRLLDHKKSTDDQQILTVVQPDICIICDAKKLDQKGCIGAPDLIIEIISPSTAKKDLNDKLHLYEENEVLEYWIVFPSEQLIQVFDLGDQQKFSLRKAYTIEDDINMRLFDDFSLALSSVFEDKMA